MPNIANFIGIDVYHGDGVIDWPTVAKQNVSFAYLKATEGVNIIDSQFVANRTNTAKNGITSGAYHFYHSELDPIAQAKHFCDTIGQVAAYEIAPCCDFEIEALPTGKTQAQAQADLHTFLQAVETTLKTNPIIYTNYNSWVYVLGNPISFSNYRLWLADYSASPRLFGGWQEWAILQYTGSGTVKGNPNVGGCDLNRYNWASGIL